MIISVALLQAIVGTSTNLNSQYGKMLTKEAAQAGIAQANACISAGQTSWVTLTPGYSCTGARIGVTPLYVAKNDNWESTYTVTKSGTTIQATGSLKYMVGAVVLGQTSQILKTSLNSVVASITAAPGSNKTVTGVATGGDHVCAISNGSVYCWGRNGNGQLGSGDNVQRTKPNPVRANPGDALYNKTIIDVQAGADHTCVIAEDNPPAATNGVYCWGLGNNGQLGNGNGTSTNLPVKVTGDGLENQHVNRINMGTNTPGANTCALTSETSTSVPNASVNAYCWGSNTNGQLGINVVGGQRSNAQRVMDPMNVLAGRQLKEISIGHTHTCGITNDSLGQIYCWGGNNTSGASLGTFGIGSTSNFNRPYPQVPINQALLGNQPASAIASGSWNSCAIAGGRVYCWGNNSRGQVGNGNINNNSSPVLVLPDGANGEPNASATDVDIDSDFTCAVINSKAKCWGNNTGQNGAIGQLGYGVSGSYATTPLTVKPPVDGKAATMVSTGYQHACAIANGILYCWGNNTYGELGTGNLVSTNAPAPMIDSQLNVGNPNIATALSAGTDHTCAIIGGSAYCWGSNAYGQLGNSDAVDQTEPTIVGGLLDGKTINFIAAGDGFTCAATDTNLIYCWGRNTNGQLGNNTLGTNSFTPVAVTMPGGSGAISALAAGADHACAVINVNVGSAPNRPEYCWGLNTSRQLGDGTTTTRRVPTRVTGTFAMGTIMAGTTYSCATQTNDSFLYCWGVNGPNGMLGNNNSTNTAFAKTRINTGAIGSATLMGITGGANVACAQLSTSKNVCWGLGTSNQLANSPTASSLIPVNSYSLGAMSGKSVVATSSGSDHSCSITDDNALICWGMGANGRLGNGATSNSNPVTINGTGDMLGRSVTDVAVGASHSCAIADGLIYCWGNYLNGRLGLGSGTSADVTTPTQIQRYLTGPPSSSITTPTNVTF